MHPTINLYDEIKNVGLVDNAQLLIYIAFSKKIPQSEKYVKMFEESLKSLTATGYLADLKKKYNINN